MRHHSAFPVVQKSCSPEPDADWVMGTGQVWGVRNGYRISMICTMQGEGASNIAGKD